jgi:hypothetical protein
MAKQTVNDLKKAVRACNGDAQCITNAQKAFVSAAGGGTQEGGKVFTDSLGGKVFITNTGGKVFP